MVQTLSNKKQWLALSSRTIIRLFPTILIFLLYFSETVYAQRFPEWRFITSLDGLRESWISSITFDSDGRLLINHGDVSEMSIYDGYLISRLPSPGPGVEIQEDPAGQLWSVKPFSGGGFLKFEKGKWILFPLPSDQHSISITPNTPFYPHSQKTILFVTPEALFAYSPRNQNLQALKNSSETELEHFYDLKPAKSEGCWITGEKGLALFFPERDSNSNWQEYLLPQNYQFTPRSTLFEDSSGNCYIAGMMDNRDQSVALQFDGTNWIPLDVPIPANFTAIWPGNDDVWVQTVRFSQVPLYQVSQSAVIPIPNNRVLSGAFHDILPQSNGTFFLATSHGLAFHAPTIWRTPLSMSEFPFPFFSITEDESGRIYFLSRTHLFVLDEKNWKQYSIPEQYISNYILGNLYPFSDDEVILKSTGGNLLVFQPSTAQFRTIEYPNNDYFMTSVKRRDGKTWTLVFDEKKRTHRLDIFDGRQNEIVIPEIDSGIIGNIRAIYEDQNGVIWIGGLKGLAVFRHNKLHYLSQLDGYTGNGVFCILEVGGGVIWIGCRDKIIAFDGSTWKEIRTTGLETVRDMIQSKDESIWVASGTGIHCFKNGSWITNTYEDGLPDGVPQTIFQDSQGRIWAGTTLGISRYYPEADREPPDTFISTDKNLKETPPDGEVRFILDGADKWKQVHSERLLYSYRFDEGEWSSFSPQTVVSATGFTAGQHSFEVKAMDRNWNIDPSPASFDFEVLLPWYQQPSFIGIIILAFLSILVSLGYALSRYLWLEKLVASRTDEIAKRESLYRTLVENLKQSIFLKDNELKFVSVNSTFCEMLGKSPAEIQGKNDFDFFPEELARKYRADDLRVLETGTTLQLVEEHESGAGKRWVEVVKTPVKDQENQITGILGIFWDITERKNLEEQLRQSQKMEAIGQLAGGIAHDFNNLLMAINGYSELLLNSIDPNDPRFLEVSEIQKAGERAASLTRQLLAFSRKQILDPKLLNLNQLISDMDKMLRRLIGEDIQLNIHLDEDLQIIQADPGQIEQIILNLSLNARDAMPAGGILTIETRNVILDKEYAQSHIDAQAGPHVLLAISDTGCGMSKEVQEKIFEPFFTTKELGKGTGLGLSTVYGIVKQSGGNIWIYSEIDKGTTFKIYFPQVAEVEQDPSRFSQRSGSLEGKETILVVEDERLLRTLLLRTLEEKGYTVLVSENGPRALQICQEYEQPIHLLITDVIMPQMNGAELASQLQSIQPDIEVLYISGYTENTIAHHGVLDEGIHFLQKPVSPDALLRKIREMLDNGN